MDGQNIRRLFRKITLGPVLTTVYDKLLPAQTFGQRGEREAERFLLRKGFIIVARGYQDKFGEIDLIAVDGETVVFVEVKTRTSDIAGSPEEAVDHKKQARITKTALGYIKFHKLEECSIRFDVIAATWPKEASRPQIQHYQSAFEAVGEYQMF